VSLTASAGDIASKVSPCRLCINCKFIGEVQYVVWSIKLTKTLVPSPLYECCECV
jgi:hypothetical protein